VRRPLKVVAYIVREGRLVVFTHAGHRFDESGLQVPAGTVRPGEPVEDAVLREAYEETGLDGLRLERFLGVAEYDSRPYREEVVVRHFFELSVSGDVPERWHAYETGDGDAEPIRFDLYWLPLHRAHVLSGGLGALLGRLSDPPP
jgi:8-oxo-dGTP diphosphatase